MDDAQRARFEVAFQSAWVDKVTRRKRTYETQAGLRLIRDKAIAYLMLDAGPPFAEIERLTLDDVELRLESGLLHIRQGNGFRERDVPLPKPAREPLEAWLMEREKLGISHAHYSWIYVPVVGDCPGARCRIWSPRQASGQVWAGSIRR